MKKLFLIVAVLATTIGFTTIVSASTPDVFDASKHHIVWSDEFSGDTLNTNNWEIMQGNGNWYGLHDWGNNEKQIYKPENLSVGNGWLTITAKNENTMWASRQYSYTSARIRSKGKVAVGLGYVEARIFLPSVRGLWPAFWMLGNSTDSWPRCGEIDIMERTNTNAFYGSTVHFYDSKQQGNDRYVSRNKALDFSGWHTYGLYRDGEYVAFYSDGVKVWEYKIPEKTETSYPGVLNDDYHLLLNVACGGNLTGNISPAAKDLPAMMHVDYVRYYKEGAEPTTKKPVVPTTKKQTVVKKPSKAKIKSLKNIKKRKLKVSLKKIKAVNGYQVRWCESKNFDGFESKNTKKTKMLIKGLDKKTTYYVKARAYKKVNGGKLYGRWSAKKKKKVKK